MKTQEKAAAPSAGYNVFLFAQLHDILTAFRAGGVETIVFKGAALAETVYEHIGLRSMCDIDLLIQTENGNAVGAILAGLGYRPAPNNPAVYIQTDILPVMVDVHTALAHLDRGEMARAWREAKDAVIAGVPARILSCEDTLVHIISHVSCSHGVVLGKWLRDIDRIARHYQREIDWKAVIARLDQCRLAAPARYIFARTVREFHTPLPPWVHTELESKDKNPFHAFFFSLILSRKQPIRYLDYLLPVVMTKGFFNKVKFIFRWLFPPTGIIKNRFGISHPILIPFGYAGRILTLIAKACVGMVDLLRCGFMDACKQSRRPNR